MSQALWEKVHNFHGHICPGITVGYRASLLALKLLGQEGKNIGATHTVIIENDVCGVDGVQYVTGCTVGNDSLIIDNQGRQAFNFIAKSGRGIRVALKYPLWGSNYPIALHQKVKTGTASEAEKSEFFSLRNKRGQLLYELLDDELFKVTDIEVRLPGKPRLHPITVCNICGEEVMSPWAVEHENGLACKSHFK
jgi:formylmethanofuran dehydrogenase subunit E